MAEVPRRRPYGQHPALSRPRSASALDKYTENKPNALVFTGIKGGPLRRSNSNKVTRWVHVVMLLGVLGLHFHDLRHTGNMLAAATGATTKDLIAWS
ncbi:hypothetical protein [Actinomadura sp. DC4]|uniref:hypothetical protein n=1 Tax=Actinomadura sp. DC4 TaxID=3055069 RepID=UPI0025B1EDAE|nr:hypothetical protein [Actinomadura sp. DC4]MDN3353176.1 hypothetical protein [Actinomadura sp. DC4]